MHPRQALERLLLSLFSADELRRWIRYLPDGESVTASLPGAQASPALLVAEAVAALERDGVLRVPGFWARLAEERPRRTAEIDRVRATFVLDDETAPDERRPGSPALTVLMVSASPDTNVRLRVDREFKKIIERVRGTRHRDRIRFEQVQAATFDDLRTALMEHEPNVLHISSHGTEDGSLLFEGEGSGARVVPKKNIIRLLSSLRGNLRLVFLNACHSRTVACDLPPTIDLAIGMDHEVTDTAAINFAVAFYEALGFGQLVETAFEAALAGLDGPEDEIPKLFPPETSDPDDKRKRPLIGRGGGVDGSLR